jgi:hypothetical protein
MIASMSRLNPVIIIAVCLIDVVCRGAATAPVLDPPQGTFFDQYYSIYVGESKCGWAHTDMVRTGDRIITRQATVLRLARQESRMEMVNDVQLTESVDGHPLAFSAKTAVTGMGATTYQGSIQDGKATMTITQGNQSVRHQFDMPGDVAMVWGAYRKAITEGLQPGTHYDLASFDPSLGPGQFLRSAVTLDGPVTKTFDGKQYTGLRDITRTKSPIAMTATSLLDERGFPVISEIPLGMLTIVLVAVDQKEALENIHAKELFLQSFVALDKPLELPKAGPIYLKIQLLSQPQGSIDLPETAIQRIVQRDAQQIVLELSCGFSAPPAATMPAATTSAPATTRSADTEKYLADSSYLNLSDPLLRKLVADAIKPEETPLAKAKTLCRLVYSHITEKDLSVPFASAAEAARSQQGDCTEHAVMLTALGRIAGLPTRAVIGLVYIPDAPTHGAYGYHMWAQFLIDGRWVDFDATRPNIHTAGDHIALAISDLTDEGFISQVFSVVHMMGQLKIEQTSLSTSMPATAPAEQPSP